MRLLKLTTFYPHFLEQLYRKHPALEHEPFEVQKAHIDHEAFGWADFWSVALDPLGYEVSEITLNAQQLQRAWARENLPASMRDCPLEQIAVEQIRRFAPDIVWFEAHHPVILKQLSAERTSIKLLVGWSGSALPDLDGFDLYDLVLSCAPEAVTSLRQRGLKVEHIHHGFDSRINERILKRQPLLDLIFVGQIIRQSEFHLKREQLLEELVEKCDLHIFSSSADFGLISNLKTLAKLAAYEMNKIRKVAGVSDVMLRRVPGLRSVQRFSSKPAWPVSSKLRPHLRTARFGLDMYQTLADSKVTLNIHADSSPTHASNMRLFETTGVGSCLLTDWKSNLVELFEPDKEVMVYRSADECTEKAQWLLDNPESRQAMALAGQQRTLRDHTFARRAPLFDAIIQSALKARHKT